jgi:hypothetical protein
VYSTTSVDGGTVVSVTEGAVDEQPEMKAVEIIASNAHRKVVGIIATCLFVGLNANKTLLHHGDRQVAVFGEDGSTGKTSSI